MIQRKELTGHDLRRALAMYLECKPEDIKFVYVQSIIGGNHSIVDVEV